MSTVTVDVHAFARTEVAVVLYKNTHKCVKVLECTDSHNTAHKNILNPTDTHSQKR